MELELFEVWEPMLNKGLSFVLIVRRGHMDSYLVSTFASTVHKVLLPLAEGLSIAVCVRLVNMLIHPNLLRVSLVGLVPINLKKVPVNVFRASQATINPLEQQLLAFHAYRDLPVMPLNAKSHATNVMLVIINLMLARPIVLCVILSTTLLVKVQWDVSYVLTW